ncbi:hypothetical protein Patl1_27394 [Pistacia atlantica]|uniref:Uncharacterized protein n=1 Tax=Pistacia atlantica TaxID=434234 RepID=A0ACC1BEM0_9ROSI|nr:hypothetical protein Patl1_27394 [Pistacia atlantica]
MEYRHWVEEQNRQTYELRQQLNERFFFWIGGFRPSKLLKILVPHLDTLTDSQYMEVSNVRQSCQQAEDAVSQGMEKLQSTLAETVVAGQLVEGGYIPRIPITMEKLEALVVFVKFSSPPFPCCIFLVQIQRRLAQNHEAACKSWLQKKAYVQHLESSRLKLVQLEQELEQAIQQQNRQICELRSALEGGMSHYFELFCMKYAAAKANIFYVMSGMWKAAVECFFFCVGGFRPSELLKYMEVVNLRQSCQHAEDALSQGMGKLQSTLAETIAAGQPVEGGYIPRIPIAMEKLEALVSFVNQVRIRIIAQSSMALLWILLKYS